MMLGQKVLGTVPEGTVPADSTGTVPNDLF